MLEVGSIVLSRKGHDKDREYLIVSIDGDFAYCVDGKYRTLLTPKKKRIKHLKNTFVKYTEKDISKLYDYEIATYLKNLDILHK